VANRYRRHKRISSSRYVLDILLFALGIAFAISSFHRHSHLVTTRDAVDEACHMAGEDSLTIRMAPAWYLL
jgi:hypothetical protein